MNRIWVLLSVLALFITMNCSAATRGIDLEPVEPVQSASLEKGTYRAILIGNNDYRDPEKRWPPLQTAVSDANTLAKLLKSEYGFTDVVVMNNATRKEILVTLSSLIQRVEAHDSVLIFYAGHGYLDSHTERGFWIPVDAVGEDHTTFLRNSTIRDELIAIADRARHTLLISDSCFSGTLLRSSTRSIINEGNMERYYNKVARKKSVQIMTAGGVEYVDDNYKDSGHSPFSYFLLSELKHNNKPIVTASELSFNVEKAVANNVDQVPASGVLQGAGDELGEFIFLKIKVDVKGVPKENVNVEVEVQSTQEDASQQGEPAKRPSHSPRVLPLPTL